MTKDEAIEYGIETFYGGSLGNLLDVTAVRMRQGSKAIFPEIGTDGSVAEESDWAFISTEDKVDTGIYGAIYYFKDKKRAMCWVDHDEEK